MRRRAFLTSWTLLVALALAPGLPAAGSDKPAPVKTPIEAIYYYLPG